MKLTPADIARSIVFGQSLTIAIFAIANVVLTIVIQKPRPGRLCALILTTASYILALGCVAVVSINRVGQPTSYLLWVGLLVVTTGTLGLSLLIAHIVFHSATGLKIVKEWFGHHDT